LPREADDVVTKSNSGGGGSDDRGSGDRSSGESGGGSSRGSRAQAAMVQVDNGSARSSNKNGGANEGGGTKGGVNHDHRVQVLEEKVFNLEDKLEWAVHEIDRLSRKLSKFQKVFTDDDDQ